jgi:aquaporin Z
MTARAIVAEFVGTFCLVLAIAGAALFAAPSAGLVAVALAAGISVVSMIYAVGHISGGHFNPAVTIGLIAAGRFDSAKAPAYIIAQVLGGAAAGLMLYAVLASGIAVKTNTFVGASNHYGGAGQFGLLASMLVEVVITALFLIIIVGSISRRASTGFAGFSIGLSLALFHIIAIPVTNASLNPARSTATALFGGSLPLSQLWLFWVAPILGGVIGGVIGRYLQDE